MKLKYLMDELSKFDQETEVFIRFDDGEEGVTDVRKVAEVTWDKETPDEPDEKAILIVALY